MRNVKRFALTALALAMVAATATAIAQPPRGEHPDGPPPPRGDERGRPDGPPPHQREGMGGDLGDRDVRELVEVLRAAKCAKALGLNKEDSFRLFQAFEERKEQADALGKEHKAAMETLKKALHSEADDATINAAVDAVIEIENRKLQGNLDTFNKVSEGFNATQRAKLFVLLNEFDDDIRRMVHQARQRSMSGRSGDREGRRDGPPPHRGPGEGPRDGNGPPPHREAPPLEQ